MRSEWEVLVVYKDGSHEHFIFSQIDCPTVVHVIKLIDHELMDKGQVLKLRISAVEHEVRSPRNIVVVE